MITESTQTCQTGCQDLENKGLGRTTSYGNGGKLKVTLPHLKKKTHGDLRFPKGSFLKNMAYGFLQRTTGRECIAASIIRVGYCVENLG